MLLTHKVETLAFGNSGHGTIHSYLKSKKYTDYFDLDMVIYVFVENDLGDQIEVIKNATSLPYVELKDNIVVINDYLLSNHIEKRRFTEKFKKYFELPKAAAPSAVISFHCKSSIFKF